MNGLKPVIFEYDSVMIGQHYHWIFVLYYQKIKTDFCENIQKWLQFAYGN